MQPTRVPCVLYSPPRFPTFAFTPNQLQEIPRSQSLPGRMKYDFIPVFLLHTFPLGWSMRVDRVCLYRCCCCYHPPAAISMVGLHANLVLLLCEKEKEGSPIGYSFFLPVRISYRREERIVWILFRDLQSAWAYSGCLAYNSNLSHEPFSQFFSAMREFSRIGHFPLALLAS